MEERSRKYVPWPTSSANKPPISPRPFSLTPSSTTLPMVTSSSEGREKPNVRIRPHEDPSVEVPNKSRQISLSVHSKNPITSVEPSSVNNGGITVKTEQGIDYELTRRCNLDLNMDNRKLRRLLSNRVSAQRSRLRLDQHVNDLIKKVKTLEADLGVLNPLVESEIDANKQLRMENDTLKESLSVQEERAKLSLTQMQENQAEVKRYKELYAAQLRKGSSPDMEQSRDFDPALNFESLTIDPPESLTSP